MVMWNGMRVAKECVLPLLGTHQPPFNAEKSQFEDLWFNLKVNPNGVDMPIKQVERVDENARAEVFGNFRDWDKGCEPHVVKVVDKFYTLKRGLYIATLAFPVKIPSKAVGLHYPRSSLPRFGVMVSQAFYDSGYNGYGKGLVDVLIDEFRIGEKDAWFQFVILDAEDSKITYNGHYQREGL